MLCVICKYLTISGEAQWWAFTSLFLSILKLKQSSFTCTQFTTECSKYLNLNSCDTVLQPLKVPRLKMKKDYFDKFAKGKST